MKPDMEHPRQAIRPASRGQPPTPRGKDQELLAGWPSTTPGLPERRAPSSHSSPGRRGTGPPNAAAPREDEPGLRRQGLRPRLLGRAQPPSLPEGAERAVPAVWRAVGSP